MNKCRICLRYRKNALSIYDNTEGITFADMITSIAVVKIRKDDGITDKLCYSCRGKLLQAHNFKNNIERSDMVLQETSNMKRICFSNLSDTKIKIEIDDCKPLIPLASVENISEKIFQDGTDCISYNNVIIKKIENFCHDYEDLSHDIEKLSHDNSKKNCLKRRKSLKSLSLVEFLNSIKTESDLDCTYPQSDYDIPDDYKSDSGSNYSYDNNLALQKAKKKKNIKKHPLNKKKIEHNQPGRKNWSSLPLLKSPIQPQYLEDLRVARTEMLIQRPRKKNRKPASNYKKETICPYCGKITKSMHSHILIHTGERKFKCDQCPKAFLTQSALTKHEKRHSMIRQFKCDQCVASFIDHYSLNKHMSKHRDEKKYVCPICVKAFKWKGILRRHILIHRAGKKTHQCEICPMTFHTPDTLRHHMRVHTGERPFKCEMCSQPYSYKHDFNRHCLKKHGVCLKRRAVYVMNEEVLQREKALVRELMLKADSCIKVSDIENPFEGEGPQGALAYEQAMKAIKTNKVTIAY